MPKRVEVFDPQQRGYYTARGRRDTATENWAHEPANPEGAPAYSRSIHQCLKAEQPAGLNAKYWRSY